MGLLRWSVRVHKWVALIVGLQIALWIMGGVVMSVIPIEQVRGEHKITEWTVDPFDTGQLISLDDAAAVASIERVKEASLGHLLGKPVWRVTDADLGVFTIDAQSGKILSPVDETLARAIALGDYAKDAEISSARLLEKPPGEYAGKAPVWQIKFDDAGDTNLYIDPATAEVKARRSSTWRLYDLFWRLHIMDYDDGDDFNHPLLITAAGSALFVALSGLVLLFIKTRRSLIAWRRRRSNS